jgi:hypothetical protein
MVNDLPRGIFFRESEMRLSQVTSWIKNRKAAMSTIATLIFVGFFWRAGTGQTESVVSVRPLADVAERLQSKYRTIVTYEEPMLAYHSDLQEYSSGTWGPKMRSFSFAVMDTGPLDSIFRIIDVYNGQNGGPSFKAISSKYGIHIVPAVVKDASGQSVPATSFLDCVISVPIESRDPSGTIEAFRQAVSSVTGVKLQMTCSVIGVSFNEIFTAGEEPTFTWGVKSTNARTALSDILGHSATSLSWQLNCQPSAQPEDRFCVLNVRPITFTETNGRGLSSQKTILFDRCGNCPKLPRGIPPPE